MMVHFSSVFSLTAHARFHDIELIFSSSVSSSLDLIDRLPSLLLPTNYRTAHKLEHTDQAFGISNINNERTALAVRIELVSTVN